ncbi:hypothetical protein PLESTB_000807800 [Pleodorina starrii]|uniref:DNA-directed RNA polymerase I subunit RPA49 n=1 Tax=Pleodorina starrii TaxID=330485 RepID=A0A9W6F2G9_9CHLO|nr:hypothetical protein PLESTB_000807800 [Pleodorina starrii]
MSAKRQRVTLEMPSAGQAALPAVCYLPSILDASDVASNSLTASEGTQQSPAKRLKFNVHAKQRLGSSVQLVHAALGEIEYVGRSDGDENAGVQPCSYALGVYRPGDGKLQLVSVAGDRLFRLDTRLVDEFGSTRRRRQMTAREAGVVAADKISGGEAVKEMLGGVAARGQEGGLTREEATKRAFAQRTVPPHDPSATTASAAYPLELLLGPADRQQQRADGEAAGGAANGAAALVRELNAGFIHKLAEDQQVLAEAREKELVHPYVLSRLGPLRSIKASEEEDSHSRAHERARYLALLAALLRMNSRLNLVPKGEGLMGVAKELKIREGLAEHLLDKFYVRTEDVLRGVRYSRTDAQKAMLLSYILAVAVVVEDGFMDKEEFEELRGALKLEATKVATAMQQLGCSVKAVRLTVERSGQTMQVPAYTVSLLRQRGLNAKTLAECFPEIKVGKGKGGK